jgi:membrane fusion protein, multidrug efflux system
MPCNRLKRFATSLNAPRALRGFIFVAAIAATGLTGCSNKDAPAAAKSKADKGPPAAPVVVAEVTQQTVPLRVQAIGNVEPYTTVSVKARVDGQIVDAPFRDGQDVVKDQPLFQIDARPLQALLKQAEANLLRDKAQLERARSQEIRYKDLLSKNFVSPDAYAQFVTNVETAEATMRADEAAVETAKLQVEYATIRSPIDGRTGKIMIQLGNMVKANDTNPLVVINQVSPIYLNFAVPEQYLGAIRAAMAKHTLKVEASLTDSQGSAATDGELAFIDNAVDTTTGTVKLRARFPNQDKLLWPGQFATASLTLGEQQSAIVVPSKAVQTGPKGQFVFVVKPDLTAEQRAVLVERVDGAQSVIAKGLTPGEKVVTIGQVRLTPGIRVDPRSDPAKS